MNQNQEEVPVEQAIKITEEDWRRAAEAVERAQRELDLTNADHVVLWLEANLADETHTSLACRILDAHEALVAAAHNEGKREAYEECSSIAFDEWENSSDASSVFDDGAGSSGFRQACVAIQNAIRAKLAPEHQQGEDR